MKTTYRLLFFACCTIYVTQAYSRNTEKKTFVQIVFRDAEKNGTLQSASFAGKNIPLRERDPNNIRAVVQENVPAGEYLIKWTVTINTPFKHNKTQINTLEVKPQDSWISVVVEGKTIRLL